MKDQGIISALYLPVEGKTYSLFGNTPTTDGYYQLISQLADEVLSAYGDPRTVLEIIRKWSKRKQILKKITSGRKDTAHIAPILQLLNRSLSVYTIKAVEHLKNLSFLKFRDRRLHTSLEQYHLYMLEIELTNRIFAGDFKNTTSRIALLPHCLRDLSVDCRSEPDEFDHRCKKCSKYCFLNHSGKLLMENNIEAYIWRNADIKKKLREAIETNHTLGILGIACIPELVSGMRKCLKYGVPVIGIPLNANRCMRWMGSFNPTSVDLEQLEKLIT